MTGNAVDHPFDPTVAVWLLLVATVVALVARRLNASYPLALVITGLAVGFAGLLPQAHLDPHLLFTLLLPPLLFEAAINLHGEHLVEEWRPIALLSLVGTVLATLVGAWVLVWGCGLTWPLALVFGAIVAPTDPLSVIALLRRIGAPPRLTLIVEGESLFNDGVAVVLYLVFLKNVLGGGEPPGEIAWQFVAVMLGGIGVGIAVGNLASRVIRPIDDRLVEIMITTVVAYGSYLLAEAFGASGVIAVVAAGLAVGFDGMKVGMTEQSRDAVRAFWEYAAFVANSIVFLLIGVEAAKAHWWQHPRWVVVAIAAVLVARVISVYGLAPVLALWGAPLPTKWQHLLVWGGLRGALSLALALGLPENLPSREYIVAAIFGYVVFSLLVQGLTVGFLARRLGLTEAAT